MMNSPSTKITTKGGATELVPLPSGAKQPSQGVGVGVGSAPGSSPGPAETDRATAQTSAAMATSFLTRHSPLVTVLAEIAGKLTEHITPLSPQLPHGYAQDEADGLADDRALFIRLYREGALAEARALCCERLAGLSMGDSDGRVAWACNLTILHRDGEDYAAALAVLNLVAPFLPFTSMLTRAKYHNGLGRTYELTGQSAESLWQYEEAGRLLVEVGRVDLAVSPLSSIGRIKVAVGDVDAFGCLQVAARLALAFGDFRLLAEIAEEGVKLG